MAHEDYYKILGVSKDADDATIRRAYRRLAKQYHPDRNSSPDAVRKFKEVQEAHAVLSDPEKRKQYDRFGRAAVGGVSSGPRGERVYTWGGESQINMDDLEDLFAAFGGRGGGNRASIFDQIFGGRGRGPSQEPAQRGQDLEQTVDLTFDQALHGASVSVTLHDGGSGRRQTLDVKIPPGVADGQKIRLRGKGQPGAGGGPPGDLHLICRVEPHPVFGRHGDDIHCTVDVSVTDAVLGGRIEVPTLEGPVQMTVPPGSSSGARLRLRDRGAPRPDGTRGSQVVTLRVVVPTGLEPEERSCYETLRDIERRRSESKAATGRRA
ncbi:MAG: hypothetical protein C4547_14135 [Phycisphaerales bacterium]|nr:MAG: hypothetical protein C4547_14135 [Phycisphaerales bacterium]